jgi:Uma2 family endonuclease
MGMPDTARRYTVDEVLAFPDDGNRYELVDGELFVTPAPAQGHEIVLVRLAFCVEQHLRSFPGVALMFVSRGDVIWAPGEYVQPDLFVVPSGEVTGDWRDCQTLLLAAEIVSPSSARADRVRKRLLYQRRGVATYWVVDPDAKVVEVWRPRQDRPEIVTEALRWRVVPEARELVVDVSSLFAGLPPA